MYQYTYNLESTLRGTKLKIQAVIFATDFENADKIFYGKIASEFTPIEYSAIHLNAAYSNCQQKIIKQEVDAGISTFKAIFIVEKDFLYPPEEVEEKSFIPKFFVITISVAVFLLYLFGMFVIATYLGYLP